MLRSLTCLAVLYACAATAFADTPPDPTSPAARQAAQKYEAAVKAARDQYVTDLDAALKQVMQSGDLDEANRIDTLRKALKNAPATPAIATNAPAKNGASNTRAKPNWIVGNVTDSAGHVMKDVRYEVVAYGTTIQGGQRASVRLDVDENGHFEQELPEGLYAVMAYVEKDFNGARFHLKLHPADNKPEQTKANSKPGIVKDFVFKLSGPQPGVDPKSEIGHYGASLRLYDSQYLGEDPDKLKTKYPGSTLIVTLTPKGPAIDGTTIKPVEIKCDLSKMGNTLGQVVMDIPVTNYAVTAKLKTADGKTVPLKCSPNFRGPFEASSDLTIVQKSVYSDIDMVQYYFNP